MTPTIKVTFDPKADWNQQHFVSATVHPINGLEHLPGKPLVVRLKGQSEPTMILSCYYPSTDTVRVVSYPSLVPLGDFLEDEIVVIGRVEGMDHW